MAVALKKEDKDKEAPYRDVAQITSLDIRTLKSSIQLFHLDQKAFSHGLILKYLEQGHGPTHNFKITPNKIYRIISGQDGVQFEGFHMLLWHGTKKRHLGNILMNGFRRDSVPNPKLMYGSGIYFADRPSKSAIYCDSQTPGSIGYMLLCDVRLGKMYKAGKAHNEYTGPPTGYESVKGTGKHMPNWRGNKKYYSALVPIGETVLNERFTDFNLLYNEYIVYDPAQVIIKFLVEVKFS